MKRKIPFAISAALLVILLTLTLSAARLALSAEPTKSALAVAVYPKTLILGEEEPSLTVYAKIPFYRVEVSSLTLNGWPARSATADNRGNLVAYFDAAALPRNFSGPYTTLTLQGATANGGTFRGTDQVRILPAH